MLNKLAKILFLFFILGHSFNLFAESELDSSFGQFYKSAQYDKALEVLDQMKQNSLNTSMVYYLSGLCYSKMQEFDKAILNFSKAIELNNISSDLQYEYGQALYAANELKAARKAFAESASKEVNTLASTYYVAHISQLLEDYQLAKNSYLDIIQNPKADTKMLQVARFQLAETLLSGFKSKIFENLNDETTNVSKYIIPILNDAISTDEKSDLVTEINQRLSEILKEYDLDPNALRNGRKLSSKRYSGYLSQKIKYDDNVSLTSEENNIQQSKKKSAYFESEVYAKYDFSFKKRFVISPDFRLNYIQYQKQKDLDIYQNDSYSLFGNLKNKIEHIVNAHPASFIINLGTGKSNKAWKSTHKREAYSNEYSLEIGESFNYFSFGDTTLRAKRKNFNGENKLISNHTTSAIGDQVITLPNQHMLIALLEADFIDNYNNTKSSTSTYLSRFDYLIPEIFPKYTLGIAMAATLTDTKQQKSSRGTELMLNPSIDISKEILKNMKLSASFDFTKNKSKESGYNYSKDVFGVAFQYSF